MVSHTKNNILFLFSMITYCVSEKVTYINVEHPRVTYRNPKYLSFANLTTIRYGRSNPIYYVGLHFENLVPFDSTLQVDFYFYEFLTNEYKRSFVEFHYNWCHLTEKDMLFGSAMRQGKLLKPCPHMPDQYNLVNMTINPAFIPRGFPFTRGRIEANLTFPKLKAWVADGYIDMRISQIDKKKAKF
ncbi:uncharacterized protein LOC142979625 [Anticarsia gemmatalis]|uniref:uncharacterized protein LOC142979625 n=1 Tax=Anticarsia gemmatalis TaxID=129554 RepID=UPI003F76D116